MHKNPSNAKQWEKDKKLKEIHTERTKNWNKTHTHATNSNDSNDMQPQRYVASVVLKCRCWFCFRFGDYRCDGESERTHTNTISSQRQRQAIVWQQRNYDTSTHTHTHRSYGYVVSVDDDDDHGAVSRLQRSFGFQWVHKWVSDRGKRKRRRMQETEWLRSARNSCASVRFGR